MADWRDDLVARLDSLQLRPEREAEIIEELSQHLDDFVRDLVAGGTEPALARRAALEDLDAPGVLSQRLASIETRRPTPCHRRAHPRTGRG
jgi:hypothetical protein